MKLDDIKTKIDKIETEKKQLATRQQQLQAMMNKKKKNEDARRKIILGALILKELEKNKGLKNYVLGLVESLSERDKKLFGQITSGQQAQKNQ